MPSTLGLWYIESVIWATTIAAYEFTHSGYYPFFIKSVFFIVHIVASSCMCNQLFFFNLILLLLLHTYCPLPDSLKICLWIVFYVYCWDSDWWTTWISIKPAGNITPEVVAVQWQKGSPCLILSYLLAERHIPLDDLPTRLSQEAVINSCLLQVLNFLTLLS